MADLSKITLPNGSTYDLKDTTARAMNGFYIGTCATAAGTKDKVVTLTDATGFELRPGTIVAVKWSYTNTYSSSTSNPITLNVNGTGAKNIYYNQAHSGSGNTGTNTTIYGYINRIYYYVYDGTYWCWMNMDIADGNTFDRTVYTNNIYKAGSTAIVATNIIVADSNGLYHHLKTGAAFDITHPILYASSAVNANANLVNVYKEIPIGIATTQPGMTLTQGQPVFIKGNLSGTIFTPISTTPLTQTIPASEDGYEYIRLGYAYATGTVYVEHIHPIFAYRNGKWNEIVNDSDSTNGHVVGHDEDENVIVAWDGGEAITPDIPTGSALEISQGGTGATTAAEARVNLGLGSAATYNVVSSVNDDSNLVTGAAIKAYYEAVGIPSAISTTGGGTAAKVATCSSFKLLANSYIQVILANANTANSALTLNINSTGAKPIVINGTTSSSSNKTLPAGSYFVFYNGSNYYFRTDGKITGDITGNSETVNNHTVEKDVPSNAVFTDTTALASMTGTLPVSKGGTGATTESAARTNLGVVAKGGDTMTGQLKTSFKQSVAIGSIVSSSSTIPDLCEEMKLSSGCMGSVYITTAYTNGSNTASTGWYNYIWIPHRSGGINGAANGDATRYGNLILLGMTMNGGYTIRYDNGTLTMHKLF